MKFVFHERALAHHQWPGHPERPERVAAIVERLQREFPGEPSVTPDPANKRDLMRVHDEAFVEKIRSYPEGPYDADTFVHRETYNLALLAAGSALTAVRTAMKQKEETFALPRPPGHHAGPGYAGGFCYFNNVAIAADFLSREEGLRPVAVLDLDVHHGNGTQDIFYARKDVLYISTHQWGIFPGTGAAEEVGEGAGEGFNVNIPLPAGSGDSTFELAFDRLITPILEQARPRALVVSLGFDAHYADPIGGLTLTSQAYIGLCARLARFARERCKVPAVFVLEGGYDLNALAESAAGLATRLAGAEPALELVELHDTRLLGKGPIDRAVKTQSRFWALEAEGSS